MRHCGWLPESEVLYLFFQWSQQPNVPTLGHKTRGVRLTCNGMSWLGVCHDEVILGASDPLESLFPMNYSATLYLFFQTLLVSGLGWPLSFREDEEDSNWH